MDIDCKATRDFLAPAPGPLPPSQEATAAFAHLEGCPECTRFFAGHRAVADRVRTAGAGVVSPPGLRERIAARLSEPVRMLGADRSRRELWFAGLAIAASAVLALWLGPPMGGATPQTGQPFVQQALTLDSQSDWMETSASEPLRHWFQTNGIVEFDIPDIDGAQLWRGRMTQVGGQMSAAVDFHFEGQIPFTYIMVPGTAVFNGITGSDIMTMQSDNWNVAMWAENGTARAVLSTMDQADLLLIAQACRDKATL